MPSTRILLMGILPRHKMNFRGRLDWPMFYTEVLNPLKLHPSPSKMCMILSPWCDMPGCRP